MAHKFKQRLFWLSDAQASDGMAAYQTLRHQSSTSQKQLSGKSQEAYAEFTQLQRLLQQYHQNLGAVGKAVTAFTQHLWRRKNASGKEYGLQQLSAEAGADGRQATEVLILCDKVPLYMPI